MFEIMGDIDFSKRLPAATVKKIKSIAGLFFQSFIKEATLIGVESGDGGDYMKWLEVWFEYRGKKFHVDFCYDNGQKPIVLYSANEAQQNIDCAIVTADNLQDTIDSVDDTGHFPENTEDKPEAPEADPRNKSMEERLGKVEAAIAVLQEEVAEIKKKL